MLADVLQSHQQFCSQLLMTAAGNMPRSKAVHLRILRCCHSVQSPDRCRCGFSSLPRSINSFWNRVREAVFTASEPVSSACIPEPMGSFHSPSHRDAVFTASGWTTVFAVVFWICLVSVTQFPEVQPSYWRLLRSR